MTVLGNSLSTISGAGPSPTVSSTAVLTHNDIIDNMYFTGETWGHVGASKIELLPPPGVNNYYSIDYVEFYLNGQPTVADVDFSGLSAAALSSGGPGSVAASLILHNPEEVNTHTLNGGFLFGDRTYCLLASESFNSITDTVSIITYCGLGPFGGISIAANTIQIPKLPSPGGQKLSLNEGDKVQLTVSGGGTLPTGLFAATDYYVKIYNASSIQLSLSPGGTAEDITGNGSGTMYLTVFDAVSNGDLVCIDQAPALSILGGKLYEVINYNSLTGAFQLKGTGGIPIDLTGAGGSDSFLVVNPTIFSGFSGSNAKKLQTGDAIYFTGSTANVVKNTTYYAIKVTDISFKIATSYANAIAGTALTVGKMDTGFAYRPVIGGKPTHFYFDVVDANLVSPLPPQYSSKSNCQADPTILDNAGSKYLLSSSAKIFTTAAVDPSLDQVTISGHGFSTNDAVTIGTPQTGVSPILLDDFYMPYPLRAGNIYYVDVVDVNTIKLKYSTAPMDYVDLLNSGFTKDLTANTYNKFVIGKRGFQDIRSGDTLQITGGTGITVGQKVTVTSVIGEDLIILGSTITSVAASNISFTVHPAFNSYRIQVPSTATDVDITNSFNATAGFYPTVISLLSVATTTKSRITLAGENKIASTLPAALDNDQSDSPQVTIIQAATITVPYTNEGFLLFGGPLNQSSMVTVLSGTLADYRNNIITVDNSTALKAGQSLDLIFRKEPATGDFINISSVSGNTITTTQPHNLITGDKLIFRISGAPDSVAPSPLKLNVYYYAIVVSSSQLMVTSTLSNALSNINIVLTSAGSGSTQIVKAITGGPEGNFYMKTNYRVFEGISAQIYP